MMKISHLSDDAIRLRFVPFALKDLAKKWLYSLAAGSITSWDSFIKVFLKNPIQFLRPLSLGRTSCSSSKNLVNYFGGTLNASKTFLSNSSLWNREIETTLNSLWRFRLLNQDPLRKHVPRGILIEGWEWRMGFIWESSWKDHPMGTY